MQYLNTILADPKNCHPTPENARRIDIEEPLDDILPLDSPIYEYASSIAELGQAQSGIGRFIDQADIEIRAGEQRWLACILADVPYRIDVMEMTDQEAFELTVVENLQRHDLPPMEEAALIQQMITKGWTHETIGTQIGKSPQWVARRIQLTKLVPILQLDEHLANWPVACWELVARYTPDQQQYLADRTQYLGQLSTAKLKNWLQTNLEGRLDLANWDLAEDRIAGKISCKACPKRSSCHPALFAEYADDHDQCLDRECYTAKRLATLQQLITDSKAAGIIPVTDDWQLENQLKIARVYQYEQVKQNAKGALTALLITQDGPPEAIYIRPRSTESPSATPTPGGKKTLEERKANLEKRRLAWIFDDLLTLVAEHKKPAWLDWTHPAGASTERLLHILTAFGTGSSSAGFADPKEPWKRSNPVDYLLADHDDEFRNLTSWKLACNGILEAWKYRTKAGMIGDTAEEDARWLASTLELDYQDVYDRACQAIRTPKGWAKEEAAALAAEELARAAEDAGILDKPKKKAKAKAKKAKATA